MSKKSNLLKNMSEDLSKINIDVNNINSNMLKELREKLLYTSDERHSSYTIYSMVDVLIITILAVLSDCDEWTQIVMFTKKHYNWLNQFLDLNDGIPSKDTFKRIISIINPKEIEPILVSTFIEIIKQYQDIFNDNSKHRNEKDVWSMDGKNCNSSGRISSKNGEINIDSLKDAWQTESSLKITRMAFNLWNNCNYDSMEDVENGNI